MVRVQLRLATIVNEFNEYDLSGADAGAGQMRDERDNDYGHFDLERCDNGDDQKNFLENKDKEYYLVYWWYQLDNERFVQLTMYGSVRKTR